MSSQPTFTTYLGRNNALLEDNSPAVAETIHLEGYLPKDLLEAFAHHFAAHGYMALANAARVYEHFSFRRAYTYDIRDAKGHVLQLQAIPAANQWQLTVHGWKEPITGPLPARAA